MMQGAQPGTTFRATWIGAWDNQVMGIWVQNCINRKLDCPTANLGNGKAVRAGPDFVTTASPRLVPLPDSPTPTPTPTPAPVPNPTPIPVPPGTHIENKVAIEGDSISVYGAGMYTGLYMSSHPNVSTCLLATGGHDIRNLIADVSTVTNCNAEVVTVFIGANDLFNSDPNFNETWFLNNLWAYTDSLRAQGYKVAVATILPNGMTQYPAHHAAFLAKRPVVNAAIRAAVGRHHDAVIDFAANSTIGDDADALDKSKYPDGQHPSGSVHAIMASIYGPVVDQLLSR
jgi:lysophospholipase L1-like esterase